MANHVILFSFFAQWYQNPILVGELVKVSSLVKVGLDGMVYKELEEIGQNILMEFLHVINMQMPLFQ